MKAIVGEKLGMTQIFDDTSEAIPVTVIKAGPVHVTQIKTAATDGYDAIQIAYKELAAKQVNRPTAGHFAKAGVAPAKHLVEVRVDGTVVLVLGAAPEHEESGVHFVPFAATFTATFTPRYLATTADVEAARGNGTALVDARPEGQFTGNGKHDRARAPGTIPGAVNLQIYYVGSVWL